MSPQSLARTRDKRSLRVPRKFEDFSLVTSAETAQEVLSTSNSSAPATTSSTSVTTSPTASNTSNSTPPSTTPSSATTTTTTTTTASVSVAGPVPGPTTSPPTVSSTPPPSTSSTTTTTPSVPTTAATPSIATPPPVSHSTTSTPTNTKTTTTTTTAPTTILAPAPVVTSLPAPIKPAAPGSIKSSSRKKSKGLSLMAKSPTGNGPFQNNDSVNRTPMAAQPQQTKYYNGISQNMQYGTRLMLNEPIYLPQSVATIAPITATLQQIAGLARRPPFLSKKAEACFAYQEQRKFSNIVSNYMAIIRITKYLELEDVLNLKSLNRSWRSALSCEAAWQRVLIKSTNVINWKLFSQNILCRYHTSELIFEQYLPSTPTKPIVEALAKSSIKRLWIKTGDEYQNRFAMELICGLNVLDCHIKIKCRLKVVVDDNGLALVPIAIQKDRNVLEATTSEHKPVPLYYCYQVCPELLNCNNDTILVELSDLEELFNRCSNQTLERRISRSARVDLKPI